MNHNPSDNPSSKDEEEFSVREQFARSEEGADEEEFSVKNQFERESENFPGPVPVEEPTAALLPGTGGRRHAGESIRRPFDMANLMQSLDFIKIGRGMLRKKSLILACTAALFIPFTLLGIRKAALTTYTATAKLIYRTDGRKSVDTGPGGSRFSIRPLAKSTAVSMISFSENFKQLKERLPEIPLSAKELRLYLDISADRRSDLIELTLSQIPDEALAVQAINTFAAIAAEHSAEIYRKTAHEALEEFRIQRIAAEEQRSRLEKELEAFQVRHQVLELTQQHQVYFKTLATLRERLSQTQLNYDSLLVRINRYRELITGLPEEVVASTAEDNPIKRRLTNMEVSLMSARTLYAADNPKIRQMEQEIEETRKLLQNSNFDEFRERTYIPNPVKKEFETELLRLEAEQNVVQEQIKKLEAETVATVSQFDTMPRIQREYALLLEQKSQADVLFNSLTLSERSAELSLKMDLVDFDIAEPAYKASGDTSLLSIVLPIAGLILGLGGGIFLALLLELTDNKIRTPRQLDTAYSAPCLSTIPKLARLRPEEAYERLLPFLREIGERLDVLMDGERLNSLGFISTLDREGKSTVAFNFARYYKSLGLRVLYMDFDHAPNEQLGREKPGWTPASIDDYLRGKASMEELIWKTPHMDVIKTDRAEPEMLELMKRPAMGRLWDALGGAYDLVVAEIPTVLDNPLNSAVAPLMDRLIYLIGSPVGDKRMIDAGLEHLENRGIIPAALILNLMDPYFLDDIRKQRLARTPNPENLLKRLERFAWIQRLIKKDPSE